MHDPLKYLQAYPASLQDQVRQLIAENRLGEYLERRYPGRHDVQSDKALYAYTMNLKQEHLRNAPAWTRCSTTTSSTWSSVPSACTPRSRGCRAASSRRRRKSAWLPVQDAAPEFLRMIVVHELAHLKESEHNKAFYQLCQYMLPDYHQLEFDLRVYLTWKSL